MDGAQSRRCAVGGDGSVGDRPPVPRRPGAAGRRRAGRGPPDRPVLRERDQQPAAVRRAPTRPRIPKDGINDHVVGGAATVNPDRQGTKAAFWYRLPVEPAATVELRLRLRPARRRAGGRGGARSRLRPGRRPSAAQEADAFYAELTPPGRPADEAMVMRQAFAGMLWSKQLYAYDVARWLDGDPTQPAPPASRDDGRNARWRSFEAFDIMSMPDKWEYPWFAAWDLGLPLRRPRPPRPGVRQVPAAAAVPRVVPASQRRAARLRVGLRGRQPAGAGLGRARGVRHRRRSRPRLPQPGVRQAAGELHLVGQPRGRQRLEPVRGRVPRPRQHRPARPLASPGRRHARAVRRHRLDGLLRARHGRASPRSSTAPAGGPALGPGAQVPRALRRRSVTPWPPRRVGRRPTASTTTSSSPPTGPRCR